jgi:hypothetical protein
MLQRRKQKRENKHNEWNPHHEKDT